MTNMSLTIHREKNISNRHNSSVITLDQHKYNRHSKQYLYHHYSQHRKHTSALVSASSQALKIVSYCVDVMKLFYPILKELSCPVHSVANTFIHLA